MPFKTKRQKARASARRFEILETGAVSYQVTDGANTSSLRLKEPQPVDEKRGKVIEGLPYVGGDLVKIGICASLVIALQILLSLVRAPLKVW